MVFKPHFGAGADIEGLIPGQSTANAVGIASFNAYGHLFNALGDKNIDPFVTGGYSIVFRNFAANGVNVGGGINYWFREKVGLVLAGRFAHATVQSVGTNFLEVRIGLTFR